MLLFGQSAGNIRKHGFHLYFEGFFLQHVPPKSVKMTKNDGLEPQLIRLWCEPTVKCKDSNNFRNIKCPFPDDPRNHLPSGYLARLQNHHLENVAIFSNLMYLNRLFLWAIFDSYAQLCETTKG